MDYPDLYSLYASDEPTARRQASAMAQAIRNSQALGELALMGGPRGHAIGSALLNEAQDQSGQIAQAAHQRAGMNFQDASELRKHGWDVEEKALANQWDREKLGLTQQQAIALEKMREMGADRRQQALIKSQMELENRRIEAGKYEKAARANAAGKVLASQQAAQLGDLETSKTALDDLQKAWGSKTTGDIWSSPEHRLGSIVSKVGAFGLGDKLNNVLNSDVAQYNDQRRAAAQVIGKYLEGGKLTDADYEKKFVPMLPEPGDTKERADNKAKILRDMMENYYKNKLNSFGSAGYNVSGYPDETSDSIPVNQGEPGAAPRTQKLNGKLFHEVAPGIWETDE